MAKTLNAKIGKKHFKKYCVYIGITIAAWIILSLNRNVQASDNGKICLLRENAVLTYAPQVPPPITRKKPAIVKVTLDSNVKIAEVKTGLQYKFWAFNDHVPGP